VDQSIGLIGAGAMGGAIGTRLLKVGQQLVVFDLDQERVNELQNLGAIPAQSAVEVGQKCKAIIVSLNSAKIVELAVFGDDGVVNGVGEGTLIIDMSSIDPSSTREFSKRAKDMGLRWVDSPLSGGAPKALIGELTLMAGGAANDVEDAHKILLKGGRADSALLQEYLPRFVEKDYRRTGRIDNMVKDLNGAQDLARQTNTSMPLTAVCAEVHRMLTKAGLGGEDQAALMEYFSGPDKTQFNS